MPTTDRREIYDRAMVIIDKLDGLNVDVGYFTGEIASIALYNDMGTRTIPSRPFMRTAFAKMKDKVPGLFRTFIGKAIFQGTMTATGIMAGVGSRVVGEIKRNITNWTSPPNAPSTARQKHGSTKPLIDTGKMRRSTTFEVRRGETAVMVSYKGD